MNALTTEEAQNNPDGIYSTESIKYVCELIWQTLGCAKDRSGAYNVGSGVSYSNLEVAHAIKGFDRSGTED